MPKQYIEFVTKPGYATIWDERPADIPADLVAEVDPSHLLRLAFPSNRFEKSWVGGQGYAIIDTVEGWEVAFANDHSDLLPGTSEQLADIVVNALNRSWEATEDIHFDCEPDALEEYA